MRIWCWMVWLQLLAWLLPRWPLLAHFFSFCFFGVREVSWWDEGCSRTGRLREMPCSGSLLNPGWPGQVCGSGAPRTGSHSVMALRLVAKLLFPCHVLVSSQYVRTAVLNLNCFCIKMWLNSNILISSYLSNLFFFLRFSLLVLGPL